jgi:enhancing lycopene biosynthesis protein 2
VATGKITPPKSIETPEDAEVREAVEAVLALRKLGRDSHMSTNKSQTHVLQKLGPDALRRAALILAAFDTERGGQ